MTSRKSLEEGGITSPGRFSAERVVQRQTSADLLEEQQHVRAQVEELLLVAGRLVVQRPDAWQVVQIKVALWARTSLKTNKVFALPWKDHAGTHSPLFRNRGAGNTPGVCMVNMGTMIQKKQ